jgi:hypothetical protein
MHNVAITTDLMMCPRIRHMDGKGDGAGGNRPIATEGAGRDAPQDRRGGGDIPGGGSATSITSGALANIVAGEFARSGPNARFLFTCRFTKTMKLNVLLLHHCLRVRNEKGICVSIDRPHSYMQFALKKLDVPQDGLIFIDAISKLTGQRSEGSMVRFLADGLSLPILDDLFSRAYVAEGAERHFVKLEDLNFLLVDNVNVILQYCSMDKTRNLLSGLADMVKKYTSMRTIFVLDPGSNREIYDFLKPLCDRELSVSEDWL